jgi:hypothetical protein
MKTLKNLLATLALIAFVGGIAATATACGDDGGTTTVGDGDGDGD